MRERRLKSKIIICLIIVLNFGFLKANETRKLNINNKYLNLPVSHQSPMVRMQIKNGDQLFRIFDIQLAEKEPQYWVFVDVRVSALIMAKPNFPIFHHSNMPTGMKPFAWVHSKRFWISKAKDYRWAWCWGTIKWLRNNLLFLKKSLRI